MKDIEKQRKITQLLIENILGYDSKPSTEQKALKNAALPEDMDSFGPDIVHTNNQIIINAVYSLKGKFLKRTKLISFLCSSFINIKL